jgi:hypothetical protein
MQKGLSEVVDFIGARPGQNQQMATYPSIGGFNRDKRLKPPSTAGRQP